MLLPWLNMRYAIGVDVGGTHCRVALVDEKGHILKKEKKEVGELREAHSLLERLASRIKEVSGNYLKDLSGIGLGLPGICNQKEGVIHQLPHFPSWKDVPVLQIFNRFFSCPVLFDNDANFAAVGEHWKGVARLFHSFIMLTLGTGIGGGIFLDGKIWAGDEGFAGEVGHMTIEKDGRPCACGNRGCWETYAASQAVPSGQTAESLAKAADEGNKEAKNFWAEFGAYLGIGIGNLAKITGVEKYVLGGGIANAHRHFIEACRTEIQERTYLKLAESIEVIPSTLGGDGNLLGAASSVFQKL